MFNSVQFNCFPANFQFKYFRKSLEKFTQFSTTKVPQSTDSQYDKEQFPFNRIRTTRNLNFHPLFQHERFSRFPPNSLQGGPTWLGGRFRRTSKAASRWRLWHVWGKRRRVCTIIPNRPTVEETIPRSAILSSVCSANKTAPREGRKELFWALSVQNGDEKY